MLVFVATASNCPPTPLPFRVLSDHVAKHDTEFPAKRDPEAARGTKSVAQRSGKSSTTSQPDSSESCLGGLPCSEEGLLLAIVGPTEVAGDKNVDDPNSDGC